MASKERKKQSVDYERDQLLSLFSGAVLDVARVVLEEGKVYSKEEALALVEEVLKREVR